MNMLTRFMLWRRANLASSASSANSLQHYQGGWVAAAAAIAGALITSSSASDAASQQSSAANSAAQTQLQMFNTINNQQAPWRQAGVSSLNDIATLQPQFQHQFNASDLNANMAPNYAFQLAQGQGAEKNAANLQTGLVSGNAMKGLEDYTQGTAQNAYQNAFNNYNTNQTNIFNRLSSIAGMGQTATNNTGTAGTTLAGNQGSAQMASGYYQGQGTVNSANALSGGINNAMGWYQANNNSSGSGSGSSQTYGSGGGYNTASGNSTAPQTLDWSNLGTQ